MNSEGGSGGAAHGEAHQLRPGEYIGREYIQVRYAETDAQAVVYHSNFLVYFEVGRTAWIRDAGFPYGEFEKEGYALVVAEAHLRFLRPAHYDDELVVETRLIMLRTRACRFGYRIVRRGEEKPLVEGWTTLVCLGKDRRATPIPAALATAMRRRAAFLDT